MTTPNPPSSPAQTVVSPCTDAFLVVDMQHDFTHPSGSLYVTGAEALVPVINALARELPFRVRVATQDWHTADHSSFVAQGGPWPPHCIAGTMGAAPCAGLDDTPYDVLLRKGTRQEVDSYSAFCDAAGTTTGLAAYLTGRGITRVFVAGVALDVCVRATVMDALQAGLQVVLIMDASKAVGGEAAAAAATEEMIAKGAEVRVSSELASA